MLDPRQVLGNVNPTVSAAALGAIDSTIGIYQSRALLKDTVRCLAAARQLVRHRHVEVNGRYVDVPSFVVSPGDEISIKAKSKNILPIETALDARTRPKLPEWLALDDKQRVGRMVRAPMRTDLDASIQEQLIVELYSK